MNRLHNGEKWLSIISEAGAGIATGRQPREWATYAYVLQHMGSVLIHKGKSVTGGVCTGLPVGATYIVYKRCRP
ncbi:hypothetical protein AOX56_06585 [Aeromonas sobria]|uniref:Uncharacterized protein n=1 Tax=Aeromonas sobria TaxID=646 RepID=A0A2N3IMK8_AERSO|nr:hypothetical protein AOX56_06585 [Aeromonas sobria]